MTVEVARAPTGRRPAWRRVAASAGAAAVVLAAVAVAMRTTLLNALLYFPATELRLSPGDAGLAFTEVAVRTDDGEQLGAWWIPTGARPVLGHVLLFHGNAGNIGDRLGHALALTEAGFDVFLFDYRGFGASTGAPSEAGTYRDARAARAALLEQPGVAPERIFYLGESLGGAIALELALAAPPRGLILQSTFTSVRDVGRLHYPLIPRPFVPDAYPSLARIGALTAPVLVLHGDRDRIVPIEHGRTLFDAAPEPKRLHVFAGAGHNDLLPDHARPWLQAIADWARSLP